MANIYEIYSHETVKGEKVEIDQVEFTYNVEFDKTITSQIISWSLWSNHFSCWVRQDLDVLYALSPNQFKKMQILVTARAREIFEGECSEVETA